MRAAIFAAVLALAAVPSWAAGPASAPTASASAPLPAYKPGEFPDSSSPEAKVFRGNIVFQNYCILCHGTRADGKGRAAKLYNPKPSNLVLSDKNDDYKELIIRRGGAAIGRSEFMPPWGSELTDEQVGDVVAYLRSITQPKVEAPK